METKRKIRRKWKMVVAIVLVFAVMIGIGLKGEERRVEGEPDVISSIIMNNEQYLTVVANRNEIENEEEFTKLLIKMYEENSFHSVKFSTDLVDTEMVYMEVYSWRDGIKKGRHRLKMETTTKNAKYCILFVYAAPTEETALNELELFKDKWDSKYPKIYKSWHDNWATLSTYFKYPEAVRRLIYTTNAIEGFNRQLRKVTKSKAVFPSDDSLLKMLYLATMDITKKWTGHRQDWGQIHSQLEIYFEERLAGRNL